MRPLRSRLFRGDPPTPEPAAPRPRILLVEDTPEIRRRLATLLETHVRAADTTAVGDAAHGLALAASGRFDVVVADDRLGLSHGARVLVAARRASPHGARILLQSAAESDEGLVAEAEPHAVVEKPVAEADFVRLVVELLAGRPVAPGAAAFPENPEPQPPAWSHDVAAAASARAADDP